jgi:hypothetical protein
MGFLNGATVAEARSRNAGDEDGRKRKVLFPAREYSNKVCLSCHDWEQQRNEITYLVEILGLTGGLFRPSILYRSFFTTSQTSLCCIRFSSPSFNGAL